MSHWFLTLLHRPSLPSTSSRLGWRCVPRERSQSFVIPAAGVTGVTPSLSMVQIQFYRFPTQPCSRGFYFWMSAAERELLERCKPRELSQLHSGNTRSPPASVSPRPASEMCHRRCWEEVRPKPPSLCCAESAIDPLRASPDTAYTFRRKMPSRLR